jgi:signal peptidase I
MARPAQEQHLPRKRRRWVKVLAVLFACVLLYYLVVRPFAVEPFEVTSVGMLPTLEVGDVVLVDKVSYRLRGPERGDVIVFESMEGREEELIQRIVGLPGDRVGVLDGVLSVNGERQEEPYINERFPDNSSYGPTTVPEGGVFVLGDNRTNSRDSRFFGAVSREKIVGDVFLVAWPPGHIGFV